MLCVHSDLFIFLLLLFIVWHLLFFHRSYGEPVRTEVRIIRVHVARTEVQVTTEGRGWSPGWPEEASSADVHNSAGSAAGCIPISQAIKKYSTSSFPTIGVEEKSLVETTTNIELATICWISTSRSKSCKCRSFWLNKAGWGRGVDCL